MNKWFLYFALFFTSIFSAQIKNPVRFEHSINTLGENEYEVVLKATLEKGWHIYSKDLPPDSGIPTEMIVSSPQGVVLVGKPQEIGKKYDEFSEAFGTQIVYFSNQVLFKQKFKLKNPTKEAKIRTEITYQSCNDRICLAPNTLEFEKKVTPPGSDEKLEQTQDTAKVSKDAIEEGSLTHVIPQEQSKRLKINSLDFKNPLINCGIEDLENEGSTSNFTVFLLGFLGGVLALLTPCVFPMIPLTVSFFTKNSHNKTKGKRDAFIYGFFILLIFVLLSVPFFIIDGISGNILNQISTNIWLNLTFFVIFLVFALSFFGYFEIRLPNSIANKSAKAEEAGGILGIFFMALTLVIVSFSCTGPILGSLLGTVASNSSNVAILLTFALAGFGLSWALVFGLLALFPQALQSLPKSGGWMTTLKVILGFIELALALKFLSKADLVSKTFYLKRELFIAIWILITLGLVLYLFGVIRFPHDNKGQKISLTQKIFGILGIGFILYLAQGLVPSKEPKLQALSGILPPINISYFVDEKDGILGMKPFHDYFEALEEAKKQNKPILLDFTGYGCENCRKMEEFVWSEPDILTILQNDLIIASVYIDDKEELPKEEQISIDMGNGQKKKIKTIGDKWSMFQQINFNNNSQPHYVLITPDGKVINSPLSGYVKKEVFKEFLECGIGYFKKNK